MKWKEGRKGRRLSLKQWILSKTRRNRTYVDARQQVEQMRRKRRMWNRCRKGRMSWKDGRKEGMRFMMKGRVEKGGKVSMMWKREGRKGEKHVKREGKEGRRRG